jgi:tRNA(Ile)-lysidine synthase
VNVRTKLDKKHSPEAVARDLRYQELAQLLDKDECVLTAHHADDQAETVLLQLFRGSGTKGLAAMPEHKGFMQGALIRPLLGFTRAELRQYAVQNHLNWIEDESNENIGIERNFVRHKLMPIIKDHWPGIVTTLGRVAEHCAEASELSTALAAQDYAKVLGSEPDTLSIKNLLTLSNARQANVIRYWLHKLNLPTPSSIKLKHIQTDVLYCRKEANPVVHWHGAEVRRYRDDLYATNNY